MKSWQVRAIAVVITSLFGAIITMITDYHYREWTAGASVTQVNAYNLHVHSHGFLFQFMSAMIGIGILVVAVEAIVWGIQRITIPAEQVEQR